MWEALFLAALATLWQGAAVAPQPEDRRTVSEVLALQPSAFQFERTSALGERTLYAQEMATLQARANASFDPLTDADLPASLGAASVFNVDAGLLRRQMLSVLPVIGSKPTEYQREVLTAAHSRYWREAAPLLPALLPQIRTPKEFAIGVYTVLRGGDTPETRLQMRTLMVSLFPDWGTEPRLIALERRLRAQPQQSLQERPPLVDLLRAPIRPGYPVIFSFQRKSRENSGLAMVRAADGRFVRNAGGSYFTVVQMALASSRLPGTITNGNTPQGLFTIVGTATAENPWIGPTPTLESKVPKEATVAEFEHVSAGSVPEDWSEERYWSFFPPSWRGYVPMQEAWLAGLAGRDEMLIHGNTANPDYYRSEVFYPFSPSAGCLVAMEYWDKGDGRLMHSDQLSLVKAMASTGKLEGYLMVVELDDRNAPVVLADVADALMAAEQR